MTVSAIRALVLRRDERRQHFLMTAIKRAVHKQHRLSEPHHVFKQRRVSRKTLENARYLRTTEVLAELRIEAHDFRRRILFVYHGQVRSRNRL